MVQATRPMVMGPDRMLGQPQAAGKPKTTDTRA